MSSRTLNLAQPINQPPLGWHCSHPLTPFCA